MTQLCKWNSGSALRTCLRPKVEAHSRLGFVSLQIVITGALAVLVGLLLLAGHRALAQQVVVLGPDLKPKTISLDAVSLSDQGLLRLQAGFGVLTPLNEEQFVTTLVDGQSLVGTLMGAGPDGESIRLVFGYEQRTAVLSLDELVSMVRVGHRVAGDEKDDTLLLATGETLVGFVDSVGKDSVGFIIGDADDPIDIPMQRVLGFSIANKPKPIDPSKGMARVQLRDSSVLYLRNAEISRAAEEKPVGVKGTMVLEPRTTAVTLPLDHIQLIEPMSTGYALWALADLRMHTIDGGEVFGVPTPPRFTVEGALKLHAPITVGLDLPRGASRLAMTVAMDLGDSLPEARRAMAGCELVVYQGDRPIARHALTPEGPAKRLNLPLTGGQLRLGLEPGVNGPVLDRVIITDTQILVSE